MTARIRRLGQTTLGSLALAATLAPAAGPADVKRIVQMLRSLLPDVHFEVDATGTATRSRARKRP